MPDAGDVRDKRAGESCTTDANNNQTCTTYHEVQLHRALRIEWIGVDWHTYQDVRPGDHADLLTWHGAVVRMVVHGHTETYPPTAESEMFWPLAGLWLLLGLAVWVVLSADPTHLFAFGNFGWLWLAMPVSWIAQGVLLGSSWLWWIVSIVIAGFGVFWTLGAWGVGMPRRLFRKRRW